MPKALTEDLVQAVSNFLNVPLVKVMGLVGGSTDAGVESSNEELFEASSLLLFIQHGNVVLEGIGNPAIPETDIGNSLQIWGESAG